MKSSPAVTATASRRTDGLWLALILGVVFLLLSYVRILGDTQSMGFRNKVLDSIFAGDIWGSVLMRNILLFVAGLLFLHLVFAVIVWLLARAMRFAWPAAQITLKQAVFVWFLLLVVAVFANNAAVFPRSSLGGPYALTLMKPVAGVMLGRWIAGFIVGFAVFTAVAALAKAWREGFRPGRRTALAAGGISLLAGLVAFSNLPPKRTAAGAKPNLILIGIDSLRHDMVDPKTSPHVAPNIEAFIQQSTEFSNAITPLARTFPSMMSILTGRHPHSTGAVINLLPRDMIKEGDTLPRILAPEGYHSAYAMDEVRFANIDTSFGFDTVVSPRIGASEFLISMFADTPLFNPVVNTTLGRWMFPLIHANRGAATTYDPDTFIDRIEREVSWQQPVFLATHLTLPHWPYVWFDAPVTASAHERTMTQTWPDYYLNVVRRVDQQFARLMGVLERQGVLENAIVIVYSDHGEAFGNPRESMIPESDPLLLQLKAIPNWGHGNSVLSPHQYHVVMGIRGYGASEKIAARGVSLAAPISVLDIAPTLAELANIQKRPAFDGSSLAPLLRNEANAAAAFHARTRFTETEYAPSLTMENGKLSTSQLLQAAELYRVDTETDRVEVRREHTKELLTIRQYAAIGDQWLLAAIPNATPGGPSHEFLYVPVGGGFPRKLAGAPAADAPEELHRLWKDLHAEFGTLLPPLPEGVASPTVSGNQQTVTPSVTK
jgi:arylsulfatase A-like enzyme